MKCHSALPDDAEERKAQRHTYLLQFCNHLMTCSFLQPLFFSLPSNNDLNSVPTSATYLSGYHFSSVSLTQRLHSQSPGSSTPGHPALPLKKSLLHESGAQKPSPVGLAVDTKTPEFRFSVSIPFYVTGSEIQLIQTSEAEANM